MDNKRIRLVIIHPSAFTKRWLSYYHLDELAETFDVEWWNISAIAAPHYNIQSIDRPYVRSFTTKRSFLQALRRLPKDTLIDFDRVMFCRENYLLLNAMAKVFHKVVWFNFFGGDVSVKIKGGQITVGEINIDTANVNVCSPIKKSFIKRCITRTKKILSKSHHLAFLIETLRDKGNDAQSNQIKWFQMCWNLFDTSIISNDKDSQYLIHSQDYEQYVQKGNPQPVDEKFIVYIDQNFPLHPETARQYPQIDIKSLADEFYEGMHRFFDLVEQQTGQKIVIALHPSSIYEPHTFGNRPFVLGQTAELVRDSEAVIVHNSTAINYAVFWNKPILLCHNMAYRKCNIEYNMLNTFVHYFQMPSCDTDVVQNVHFEQMPNDQRNDFMSYCTNDRIAGRRNIDLYVDYLVEIHQKINQ